MKTKYTSFRTSAGEIVSGEKLTNALNSVAADWVQLARDIRSIDDYASHVSEAEKDADMNYMIGRAEEIKAGFIGSFSIWQRVNKYLTGECVALLP